MKEFAAAGCQGQIPLLLLSASVRLRIPPVEWTQISEDDPAIVSNSWVKYMGLRVRRGECLCSKCISTLIFGSAKLSVATQTVENKLHVSQPIVGPTPITARENNPNEVASSKTLSDGGLADAAIGATVGHSHRARKASALMNTTSNVPYVRNAVYHARSHTIRHVRSAIKPNVNAVWWRGFQALVVRHDCPNMTGLSTRPPVLVCRNG
jgi:hypothetical protein